MYMAKLIFIFLILIACENTKIQAYRVFDVNGVKTILAFENEYINIDCKKDMPMTYCGFVHPNGMRSSFSGYDLNDGHCTIKIQTTKEDSGEWSCHIGQKAIGVEIMQKIRLRVVNQVASVQPNITVVHGKEVILECATTKGLVPLRYCRFEPPHGAPFSVDSTVKSTNPILGTYYYPQNKSLDRGDCAVVIRKAKYDDMGIWTCGVGLDDGKEHTDTIQLEVVGLYTMSTASATGITFGVIGIAAFLVILGFIAWRKRRVLGSRAREPEVIEVQELGQLRVSHQSPGSRRSIPRVVVQSPSEPGASPLM